MHREVDWMMRVDHYILECLGKCPELELTPSVVASNIDYSRSYVGNRIRDLVKTGLVENRGDGYYQISEIGIQYVNNELSAEELRNLGASHLERED